jgi:hypothetical protein
MNVNQKQPIKANDLVLLLAQLLELDVELMARVGNVPVGNLRTWLAGKKENLRPRSVINLMSMLGLSVTDGVRLDPSRVHYWNLHDGLFASRKKVTQPLTALSRLMTNCQITAVRAPSVKSGKQGKKRTYYLVSGKGVRVVVCVHHRQLIRRNLALGPEIIKGAVWRDDNDHHIIGCSDRLWSHLADRDLTTFEFDQMFTMADDSVSWNDVSLMAREIGLSAADVAEWIARKSEDQESGHNDVTSRGDEDAGFDLDGSGKLLLLTNCRFKHAA